MCVGDVDVTSVGMGLLSAEGNCRKKGSGSESLAASSLCSQGMGAFAGEGAPTGPTASNVSGSSESVIADLRKELICFQILNTEGVLHNKLVCLRMAPCGKLISDGRGTQLAWGWGRGSRTESPRQGRWRGGRLSELGGLDSVVPKLSQSLLCRPWL